MSRRFERVAALEAGLARPSGALSQERRDALVRDLSKDERLALLDTVSVRLIGERLDPIRDRAVIEAFLQAND